MPSQLELLLKDDGDRIARSAGQHARAIRKAFAAARRAFGLPPLASPPPSKPRAIDPRQMQLNLEPRHDA